MHFGTPIHRATSAAPTVSSVKSAREKQSPSENPPCVVGMACRVPGASSPSRLWDNIINQVDLQRKMPQDRFNVDAFYHPDGTHKGTVCLPIISMCGCQQPKHPYRQMPNTAIFSTRTLGFLTPVFSISPARKPRQWTRSSVSYWRSFMRP